MEKKEGGCKKNKGGRKGYGKKGGREGVRRIREEGRGMEITGKEGGRKRQREGGKKGRERGRGEGKGESGQKDKGGGRIRGS